MNDQVKYQRIPLIFAFKDTSSYKDTYAGEIGTVALTCLLYTSDAADE